MKKSRSISHETQLFFYVISLALLILGFQNCSHFNSNSGESAGAAIATPAGLGGFLNFRKTIQFFGGRQPSTLDANNIH